MPWLTQFHLVCSQTEESLPAGCRFYTMPELSARGQKSPPAKMAIPGQDGVAENPIYSLFYTSGSTGLPKGAIYREKMWWVAFSIPCAGLLFQAKVTL